MRKSEGVEQKKQSDFQNAALEKQRKKEQAIIDLTNKLFGDKE